MPDGREAAHSGISGGTLVSGFPGQRAILIYGFEDAHRPLSWLIEAFEAVAARTAVLGACQVAPLRELVYPVLSAGQVYAWEVLGNRHSV